MRTQLRIVAGSLRGRKVICTVAPTLRPTPDRVREALFNILRDAVPGRPFVDLFAGTGAVGLEAVSRGAAHVVFVERDPRIASEIARHLNQFGVADRANVYRADVYRWAEQWQAPDEPVTVFLGPPFPDYQQRLPDMIRLVADLQGKIAPDSMLVVQGEEAFDFSKLPDSARWSQRRYGRNWLFFWVKQALPAAADQP